MRQKLAISIHALLAESDIDKIPNQGKIDKFLSTLSLRRATLATWQSYNVRGISIHALLAESDNVRRDSDASQQHFYPRSPCGERLMHALILANTMLFLSTLSLRRATYTDLNSSYGALISIHALLAESDKRQPGYLFLIHLFLSTLSLRRATLDSPRRWQSF